MKDDENKDFSEKVAFVLIDLTKFAAQTNFDQLPGLKEKWCYTIKNMWRMTDGDIPVSDTAFRELYEECKLSKLIDMEKQEYEKSILEYEDVKRAVAYAGELAAKAAYEEGIDKGITEGRKEGREEGRMAALLQTAKNLLDLGLPMTDITKATGLTEEQIQTGTSPL